MHARPPCVAGGRPPLLACACGAPPTPPMVRGTAMRYNKLGDSGLLVSELSWGAWITLDVKGQVSQAEHCLEIMKAAYDGGVNTFDNAEGYSSGDAETMMGEAIRLGIERGYWVREDLVITTKIMYGTLGHASTLEGAMRVNRTGLSRKHLYEGLRASLGRLGLEYVDCVFCHSVDPATPIHEVVRAMNTMIEQGMCFYWGTSTWSAQMIEKACGVADALGLIGPTIEQPKYNMLTRDTVEKQYSQLYPRIGLTVFSPLAGGVLTGKYSGGHIPSGSRYALPRYAGLKDRLLREAAEADKIAPIAAELGCTVGQLALAWVLMNDDVSTAIFGASSVVQVGRSATATAAAAAAAASATAVPHSYRTL
jgi:voltage-dependent potassium channel beta subunit